MIIGCVRWQGREKKDTSEKENLLVKKLREDKKDDRVSGVQDKNLIVRFIHTIRAWIQLSVFYIITFSSI